MPTVLFKATKGRPNWFGDGMRLGDGDFTHCTTEIATRVCNDYEANFRTLTDAEEAEMVELRKAGKVLPVDASEKVVDLPEKPGAEPTATTAPGDDSSMVEPPPAAG